MAVKVKLVCVIVSVFVLPADFRVSLDELRVDERAELVAHVASRAVHVGWLDDRCANVSDQNTRTYIFFGWC